MKKKIFFLFTELSGYFIECCRQLVVEGNEVHVVRWPMNKEAPFEFENIEGIFIYEREQISESFLLNRINQVQPSIVICAGWIDKVYLAVCKNLPSSIVKVITMDNHWKGNVKQMLGLIYAKLFITPIFNYCWVPGEKQKCYALKLGFLPNKIKKGFYCADVKAFNKAYEQNEIAKSQKFPHVFLYVGRYVDFKGLDELWQAFNETKKASDTDWELWCAGTGPLAPIRMDGIKHLGFIQPAGLLDLMKQTGVFVLPSRVEPWAVSVQEFACAGFPIVLSNKVGAREMFLDKGKNGWEFEAENKNSLKNILNEVIATPDNMLCEMGKQSHGIGNKFKTEDWTSVIYKMMNHE